MTADIQLLQPLWLGLAPLLLLVYWLYQRNFAHAGKQSLPALAVRHPFADATDSTSASKQDKTQHLLVILTGLFLLLALSQPVRLGARLPAPPVPVDLMLIIDTSVSMVLQDYELDGKPVDRMTMTQALLDRFIQRYQGKRIGLVVLGDKPHVLLPPSEDHNLARHLVNRLQTGIAGRQSAIGDAIAIAAGHIKNEPQENATVLVLISDAVLPMGNLSPVEGARRAAGSNATLHTIAVGATSMQEQVATSLLYEPADIELMQQLADITGGRSFHAVDTSAMDEALASIEQQQTSQLSLAPQLRQALYIWPLGLAMLLLSLLSLRPYMQVRN